MPEPTVAFLRDDFCPLSEANVSVRSKGLNYGLGCFEGIRAYWSESDSQLYIFRVEEHYVRLTQSCRILGLNLPFGVERLVEITDELCRRNEHRGEDIYIRPIVFENSETLSPVISADNSVLAMYTLLLNDYLDTSKGVTACVSSWRRVSDNTIPARAKPTAAYLNSALARAEARANGFDEAIFLTNDGCVSEASAEHLFLVRDGVLVTPTSQEDNLDGITRRTICEIAPAEMGRQVETRRVSRTELYVADEAFLCGTGAQIAPLTNIDGRPVGTGSVGPITKELQELYFKIVRNRMPKYAHWRHGVYRTERQQE